MQAIADDIFPRNHPFSQNTELSCQSCMHQLIQKILHQEREIAKAQQQYQIKLPKKNCKLIEMTFFLKQRDCLGEATVPNWVAEVKASIHRKIKIHQRREIARHSDNIELHSKRKIASPYGIEMISFQEKDIVKAATVSNWVAEVKVSTHRGSFSSVKRDSKGIATMCN